MVYHHVLSLFHSRTDIGRHLTGVEERDTLCSFSWRDLCSPGRMGHKLYSLGCHPVKQHRSQQDSWIHRYHPYVENLHNKTHRPQHPHRCRSCKWGDTCNMCGSGSSGRSLEGSSEDIVPTVLVRSNPPYSSDNFCFLDPSTDYMRDHNARRSWCWSFQNDPRSRSPHSCFPV